MLRHVPVGARQQQAVVGGERTGAPGLRAVDDPLVALAVGAGDDAREIGAAAGLREQLHEDLVTAQHGPNALLLLLFGAGIQKRRRTDRERRRVEDDREFVLARLVVEGLLVGVGQTQTAVLPREADAGEAAVVEHLLEFPGTRPRFVLAAVDVGKVVRVDGRHVLGKPRPCAFGELGDRLVGIGAYRCRLGHEADSNALVSAYTRRLCSSGVPNMERYNVVRRRYMWRSCSHVTPMPPCNWTQR